MSKTKKPVSKKKQVSGGSKDSTRTKKSHNKSDLEIKYHRETDFYVICRDCGGMGRILITGADDDVDIIY